MQIPLRLRPFPVPTLIVVTDNVRANIFHAQDRALNLVQTISTKLEPMEQERVAVKLGSGGMRSGEQHEHNVEWAREQLYRELSEDLMRRLKRKEFDSLVLCAPEEHMNELKESLHIDLVKRVDASVERNLTNDDPIDIVAHVQEA
jgi:protein required for attachment to host cells